MMQASFYCLLIFIIGFSCIQGTFLRAHYHSPETTPEVPSNALEIDQAYLVIRNMNYSDNILLLTNLVTCEKCDFDELVVVAPGSNTTQIITTKFPYNIQLQAWPSKKRLQCQISWYRFAEHGTYLLEVIGTTQSNGDACSITQIGETSHFWTPVIVGILFFIALVVIVQFWQRLCHSRYFDNLLSNLVHQRSINNYLEHTSSRTSTRPRSQQANESGNEIGHAITNDRESPLVGLTSPSNNSIQITKVLPKRLRSLDTFRGFSLMVMIFVNYGGGGYQFFHHSVWNGLTIADLVFPWFTWMMGVSIVLSQRSLRSKGIRKRSSLLKICRRTAVLFILGLATQGGSGMLKDLRIFGVLQRLALCYFFTAVLVLAFDHQDDESNTIRYPIDDSAHQPIRIELSKTILKFWLQWLFVLLITIAWFVITFLVEVPGCPKGYLGPGGKHEHGRYQNCTGGAAGYIDRIILSSSHMFNNPTCKAVYDTQVPYDPEGILGILTGILLCYLGVHAGHSFVHSTRVSRVCAHWLVSGVICGFLGILLSKGGHTNGWIPINKNLWSLTFVLVLASLAFIILTIFYLIVDVHQWFTGAPFLWLGMNSIVLYVGHELFSGRFPVQFAVDKTHTKLTAMHLYGVFFWTIIAGLMYRKKFFIAL